MSATVVLDQQVRNGTFDTSSVAVPTGDNPDTGQPWAFILLTSTMSETDAANPAYSAVVAIRASYDGTNYVLANSATWTGGSIDRHTGHYQGPGFGISIQADDAGNPPLRYMASIDTAGNSLNTGLTLGFQ